MAQYKVPQDVEADDKLIGPFSFRQFVYLLIAGGLIGIGVGLFQIFPALVLLVVPPVLLLLALALPIKKDQPMETYLVALASYYIKSHKRFWTPGQKDTTILITAPKIVEEVKTRDISGEEATHRLSFLADIVDSGGQSIKGMNESPMREDLFAEATMANDMFENSQSQRIERAINQDKVNRHEDVVKEMREVIEKNNQFTYGTLAEKDRPVEEPVAPVEPVAPAPAPAPEPVSTPAPAPAEKPPVVEKPVEKSDDVIIMPERKNTTSGIKPSIIELANNPVFSVATIEKEANRLKRKEKGEVFISLH